MSAVEDKVDYFFVKDQFYQENIPAEQMANVILLIDLEREMFEVHGTEINEFKKYYEKERDKAAYCMIANGKIQGCNTFRAMAGYKEDILGWNRNSGILVHRLGSKLNFGLIKNLGIPQSRGDGKSFIKRGYERAKYQSRIRYNLL